MEIKESSNGMKFLLSKEAEIKAIEQGTMSDIGVIKMKEVLDSYQKMMKNSMFLMF